MSGLRRSLIATLEDQQTKIDQAWRDRDCRVVIANEARSAVEAWDMTIAKLITRQHETQLRLEESEKKAPEGELDS